MPTRPASVGLVEVARLAGVSASTVSGVFRDTGEVYSVSPATRAKVMEAATRLGYRPNSLARAMRRRRFQQVGFLVQQPTRSFNVMPESLSGVFDATTAAGLHLVFIGMHPDFAGESRSLPPSFQEECIDCLVVDGTLGFTPEFARVLHGARFPVVFLNLDRSVNAVVVDDAAAGREAAEHLLRKGRRRVAFFSHERPYRDTHSSFRARREAYHRVMAEAGLPAREISLTPDAAGEADGASILSRADRPDALVCYNDADAVMVQRLTSRLGLRVPDDLDLIGFNGATAAVFSPHPLTTMQIPWYDLGRSAAEMALKLSFDRTVTELPAQVFRAKLVEGVTGVGAVL